MEAPRRCFFFLFFFCYPLPLFLFKTRPSLSFFSPPPYFFFWRGNRRLFFFSFIIFFPGPPPGGRNWSLYGGKPNRLGGFPSFFPFLLPQGSFFFPRLGVAREKGKKVNYNNMSFPFFPLSFFSSIAGTFFRPFLLWTRRGNRRRRDPVSFPLSSFFSPPPLCPGRFFLLGG